MKVLCSGGIYNEITTDECLSCALRNDGGPCGYSYPLLKAMFAGQESDQRRNEIHVSDIKGCLRKAYLDKTDPKPTYVHKMIPLFVGIAVHKVVEMAVEDDPNVQAEVPVEIGNVLGRIDFISGDTMWDIKTTRWMTPSKLPYGEHESQINIYNTQHNLNMKIQYIDVSGASTCRKCKDILEPEDGLLVCKTCGYIGDANAHLGAKIIEVERMEVLDEVNERAAMLAKSMQIGNMPDPEPSWLCRYCSHTNCEKHPKFVPVYEVVDV